MKYMLEHIYRVCSDGVQQTMRTTTTTTKRIARCFRLIARGVCIEMIVFAHSKHHIKDECQPVNHSWFEIIYCWQERYIWIVEIWFCLRMYWRISFTNTSILRRWMLDFWHLFCKWFISYIWSRKNVWQNNCSKFVSVRICIKAEKRFLIYLLSNLYLFLLSHNFVKEIQRKTKNISL